MTPFLAPAAFFLAALIPIVVLMYLLKLKRQPKLISSTLLWRRSVQDMVANAPFQKLRNNLLLWLQLLILILLIFALARPILNLTGLTGQSVILMIDRSASMQTVEADGETRIEKAKKLALEAIDDLGSKDQMMVIAFSNTTQPLQTMTGDKTALRAAVRELEVKDTATDLEMASLILQEKTMKKNVDGDMLEPNENARVILISDGGLGPSATSLVDIPNIDFVSVGSQFENIGFTGVDVRESFTGTFEYQVFASLYNSGIEDREVYVEMHFEDEAIDLKKVTVPSKGEAAVVFTLGEEISGLATLKLANYSDAFELDNEVTAAVAPPTEIKVLVVSTGNPFLERVFAIDPRTTVSIIRPTEYNPRDDFDITIFEGTTVGEIPAGNFLFVNSLPPPDLGYSQEGEEMIQNPNIIDWNRVHPLMRYANFENVLIAEARKLNVPEAATSLVEAVDTDLISLLESETQRIIVINFDIRKSYWPVDVSFPIFISNVIDYINRQGAGMSKPVYPTGEQIPIVPPRDAKSATVRTPGGERQDFNLEGRTVAWFSNADKAGVYDVTFDGSEMRRVPVNLLSSLESEIEPVTELELGARKITATQESVRTKQEIWHWLALAGLAILMLEWGIYCRRTFM